MDVKKQEAPAKYNHQSIALEMVADLDPHRINELLMHIIRVRPSVVAQAVQSISCPNVLKDKLELIMQVQTANQANLVDRRIINASKKYDKISCIKIYREITKFGLRESKEAVEELEQKYNLRFGNIIYRRPN